MNRFLHNTGKHSTFTENMAVAHSTTGSTLADQFSKAGSQRGRDINWVFAEQSALHQQDPVLALRFVFYLRMVTRKVEFWGTKTEKVQKGQGNRDEAFKRFLWYCQAHPDTFFKNLPLFVAVGRFQDYFDLLFIAYQYGVPLSMRGVLEVVVDYAASNENQHDLLKKYVPLPRAKSKLKTPRAVFMNAIALKLCSILGMNSAELRRWKRDGEAHKWQQFISRREYNMINFDHVPGRALGMVSSEKFLASSKLQEKYIDWIESKPVAKFTGYPFELGKKVSPRMGIASRLTVDKQFEGLIQLAKQDQGGIQGNVWCALDTSGSMQWENASVGVTAYQVCLSLGIYFSALNEGAFHKNVIMFDNESRTKQLSGSFTDMWMQLESSSTAWGGTNFQSVVDEIVRIRVRNPDVPLEDYPTTLLVVSDMQFNPTGNEQTNHERQMQKLASVFPRDWVENFRVIWWDVTGRRPDNHPTHIDEGGTYVFSGFDGSIITLLLGGESETAVKEKRSLTLGEMIHEALNQEILREVML